MIRGCTLSEGDTRGNDHRPFDLDLKLVVKKPSSRHRNIKSSPQSTQRKSEQQQKRKNKRNTRKVSKHGKRSNNDTEKVEAHVTKSKKMGKLERIENRLNFEKSLNYDFSSIVLTLICCRLDLLSPLLVFWFFHMLLGCRTFMN